MEASTSADEQKDWTGKRWFKQAAKGRPVISPVEPLFSPFKLVFYLATPIYNMDGNIQSILVAQIDMKRIWETTDRLKIGLSGFVFLTDRYGSLIAFPDKTKLFTDISPETVRKMVLKSVIGSGEYTVNKTTKICYFKLLTGYKNFRGAGWRLGIIEEKDDAYSIIYTLKNQILFYIGCSFILILLLSGILSRHIAHPISWLAQATDMIADGNLDVEMRLTSKDEIGELGNAFSKMAKELQKSTVSKAYMDNILNSMADALFVVSPDKKVLTVNNPALALLGLNHEEIIGRFLEMLPFSKKKELDELIEKGEFRDIETEFEYGHGLSIPLLLSGSPMLDEKGNVKCIVCTARDITERKRAEQEAQLRQQQLVHADKMVSLGILVSGVAHEINNPNQFIMTHVIPLKKMWQDAEKILEKYYQENGDFMMGGREYSIRRKQIPEMFESITEGSKRIKIIVDELRNYAREHPSEINESVDCNDVVKAAVSLLTGQIKKATGNFSVTYTKNLPRIKGNHQKLEQVVINLLQNACQSLDSPEKAVRAQTKIDKKGQNVIIEIQDEGSGISPDNMAHIQDPFFTTKRETGGTGLGLSISSGIIEEHNGKLKFESDENRGTKVLLVLPIEKKQEKNCQ